MDMRRACRDYYRIEHALRFLHAHWREQPDLARLAREIHLSESQAQRLFTRWAGVSPKRFLQFLSKQEARRLLLARAPVLAVADALGLSGGGRLHDLTLKAFAMTPGEIARGGAGLRIGYGFLPSPLGQCLVAATDRGICHLAFHPEDGREQAMAELREAWPHAALQEDVAGSTALLQRIFDTAKGKGELQLLLRGTPFQLGVWEALLRIPEGQLRSYGQLAADIGKPSATRAVASAVAGNNIAYLIPCHRVIRGLGEIGGYRWGSERKQALLARECAVYTAE